MFLRLKIAFFTTQRQTVTPTRHRPNLHHKRLPGDPVRTSHTRLYCRWTCQAAVTAHIQPRYFRFPKVRKIRPIRTPGFHLLFGLHANRMTKTTLMSRLKELRPALVQLICAGLGAVLVATLFPTLVQAQIYVTPQRPTQSNVRYFDFDWHHIDIDIGPEADGADAPGSGQSWREALADSFPRLRSTDDQDRSLDSSLRPRRHGVPDFYSAAPTPLGYDDFPDPAEDTGSDAPVPPLERERDRQEPREHLFEPSDLDDRRGGVRLYFYEREREIARRAAALIKVTYRDLVDQFRFVPSRTLPYILYSSYQEFLQTNIFPVQEGVLGVTGRAELELVLPYFGDHRLFEHISTHEMVHQFQIQKAREVAADAGVSGDPLDRVPLWFIEGMAEYYALDGLDDETEMLTRDLLLNPDPRRGYVMLDFFEDRPFSQLWTYKIGQARVAFLEEFYGENTIQEVFEQSHRLLGGRDATRSPETFRSLLVDITGDSARKISDNFESWIKRRSYTSYLDAEQDSPNVEFLNDTAGIMQTMTTSPDGNVVMYRSIQPNTGQVRLYIVDTRNPGDHRRVAADGRPGVESLHPVGPRTFDIHDDQLAFVARSQGKDVLYVEQLRHDVEQRNENAWDVRLRTGDRTGYDLREFGLLAAEAPTFSPDGRRIAFVGLDEEGQKDLYLFEALDDDDFIVSRLTDNPRAERGLSWGEHGLVYTSDATEHQKYNLFRIDIDEGVGEPERLTFEERDHFDPRVLPDDRIFFGAYEDSRANLYEWTEDGVVRRTDFVTGLFEVAPGPDDTLWATLHHRGQRQPVRINGDSLLDRPLDNTDEHEVDDPPPFATMSLDDAERYRATDLNNWRINNIFGVLGASSGGVFGQLTMLTNDRLRNHAFFVNVLAFGDLENTVADVLYLNQESRLIWGAGLFQDVRYRIDRTFDGLDDPPPRFFSGERFYGARTSLRYPFNRFAFIQGDLALGGVTFFLRDPTEDMLQEEAGERPDTDFVGAWEDAHDEHRFQASPSLSLGYNTIRLHPGTGPLDGTSALLSSTLDLQPFDDEVHGTVRLDAERYFPIYDRINLSFRTGMGSTYGGDLARQFFLYSFDTLRGVSFGDIDYLLGNVFLFTKAEFRFPLNFLVRIPFIDVEGMVGADFGGAGEDIEDLWRWRAFSPVVGFNFGLGPLVFRLHFAKPIDIGAPRLPRDGDWITNLSLGWRYW